MTEELAGSGVSPSSICLEILRTTMPASTMSMKNWSATGLTPSDISLSEQEDVYLAIFAVLYWTSMTVKPILNRDPTYISPAPCAKGSDHIKSKHALRRPVVKIFRTFRKAHRERQLHDSPALPNAISLPLDLS